MSDRRISNQNLAGLLSEALGLEGDGSRSSFSSTSREALRRALEHSSQPTSFGQLRSILEELGADEFTLRVVREHASSEPDRSVVDFVEKWVQRGPETGA